MVHLPQTLEQLTNMVKPLSADFPVHNFFSWKGRVICLLSGITIAITSPFEFLFRLANLALKIATFAQSALYYTFNWATKEQLCDKGIEFADSLTLFLITPINTIVMLDRFFLGAFIHPAFVFDTQPK